MRQTLSLIALLVASFTICQFAFANGDAVNPEVEVAKLAQGVLPEQPAVAKAAIQPQNADDDDDDEDEEFFDALDYFVDEPEDDFIEDPDESFEDARSEPFEENELGVEEVHGNPITV